MCDFLDIRRGPGELDAGFNRKAGFEKKPLPEGLHVKLVAYFQDEYEKGAALFGRHATTWLENAGPLLTALADAFRR